MSLSRRYWVIQNIDWLMDEMVFHKENAAYYRNASSVLWKLGDETGEAPLNEITRRPEQV